MNEEAGSRLPLGRPGPRAATLIILAIIAGLCLVALALDPDIVRHWQISSHGWSLLNGPASPSPS